MVVVASSDIGMCVDPSKQGSEDKRTTGREQFKVEVDEVDQVEQQVEVCD